MPPIPITPAKSGRTQFISLRGQRYQRSRALPFIFEDLIADIERATILAPEAARQGIGSRLYRTLPAVFGRLLGPAPQLELGTELAFVCMQGLGDIAGLLPLFHHGNPHGLLVAFVEEVWEQELKQSPLEMEALKRCDFVFVGCAASVEPVHKLIGRPCAHLPPSVDALRFDPFARGLDRTIDVYGMGRRDEALHDQLRSWAREQGRFYLYDTVAGNGLLKDHRQHRERFIEFVQRSKYFIVHPAKVDRADQTSGQQEVGYRYYEGAAGGAVLIGDPTNSEVFTRFFPHPDAVIPLSDRAGGFPRLIQELDAQPERLEQIRLMNVANILRQHDHSHRWATVLEALDLAPPARLKARHDQLHERAARLEDAAGTRVQGAVS